jgi:hypothetical protein
MKKTIKMNAHYAPKVEVKTSILISDEEVYENLSCWYDSSTSVNVGMNIDEEELPF